MRSTAWLAVRVPLWLARLPRTASSAQRSRRLRSTCTAAPGLLAHAEVTKTLYFLQWAQHLGTPRYPILRIFSPSTVLCSSGAPAFTCSAPFMLLALLCGAALAFILVGFATLILVLPWNTVTTASSGTLKLYLHQLCVSGTCWPWSHTNANGSVCNIAHNFEIAHSLIVLSLACGAVATALLGVLVSWLASVVACACYLRA